MPPTHTPKRLTYSIKNFRLYQHYKDRNPTWIKLYYQLLDDPEFIRLDCVSRCYYFTLLMVASRQNNVIDADPTFLRIVMRLDHEPDVTPLIHSGFLLASRYKPASSTLASCKQNALSETYTKEAYTKEESKTPKPPKLGAPVCDGFAQFWTLYPRKTGRGAAQAKWTSLHLHNSLVDTVLESVRQHRLCDQWTTANGRFIPLPATWLNQRRWEDTVPLPALLHDITWAPPTVRHSFEQG